MNKVRVTSSQFFNIRELCSKWDENARWLPQLYEYLWEQDIRPVPEASPEWPTGYQFLAGGVDHIDYGSHYITVHDRCLCSGDSIQDGTTRFWK